MNLKNDGIHELQNDGTRQILSHLMQHCAMLKKKQHLSHVRRRLPWFNYEGDTIMFLFYMHHAAHFPLLSFCDILALQMVIVKGK
jgi:hypothetical protein